MSDIAAANALINKHFVDRWIVRDSFYAGALATDVVAEINAGRYGVAFQVFAQLQARQFASSDIVNVARGVVDALDQNRLTFIATSSRDGLLLIRMMARVLRANASGNARSPRALKLNTAIAAATPQPRPNVVPTQLSEAEMTWYRAYATRRGYSFDNNICWDLPTSGTGFTTYNVDDLRGRDHGDQYGYDQIGTRATIDAMINIGVEWNRLHADRLIQYGDVSRPGGMNTPDHSTHENGKAFDMRALRNDTATGNAGRVPTPSSPAYDRALTKEFILLVRRLYPGSTVYYNDTQIYNDAAFRAFVSYSRDHDDHLHVMLNI